MIKIEYDSKKGINKIETDWAGNDNANNIAAQCCAILHWLFVEEIYEKKSKKFAEQFKENVKKAINEDLVLCSSSEAKVNIIEESLAQNIIDLLETLQKDKKADKVDKDDADMIADILINLLKSNKDE